MRMAREISDKELEEGLDLIAQLIERYDKKYGLLFDLLNTELELRKLRASKLRKRAKRGIQVPNFSEVPTHKNPIFQNVVPFPKSAEKI